MPIRYDLTKGLFDWVFILGKLNIDSLKVLSYLFFKYKMPLEAAFAITVLVKHNCPSFDPAYQISLGKGIKVVYNFFIYDGSKLYKNKPTY